MSNLVYVSKSRLERKQGPVRVAHLPGEARPVISVLCLQWINARA